MAMSEEAENRETNEIEAAPKGKPKKRRRFGAKTKWGAVVLLAVVVVAGGYWYHRHNIFYPSTDDAYIKANTVNIAPQVSGQLIKVLADDQQRVEKGELLFAIDPRPYEYKVQQAKAALDGALQTVAANEAAVTAAKAHVADEQAALTTARQNYRRDRDLAAKQVAAQSELDDARAALESAKAQLNLANAQLNEAEKTLGKTGEQNHHVETAKAQLAQAKLDLANTSVVAPCTGRLTGFTVQTGDVVNAETKQATLVCSKRFWVYANYKETDLTRIRPGQSASVTVDMYPGKTFHGIVESVDPASGAAFSLLPPENASGNWVKVTQRVPVRILITDAGENYPMRVQTSAEVTVDTGTRSTPLGKRRGATVTDAEAMKIAGTLGTQS